MYQTFHKDDGIAHNGNVVLVNDVEPSQMREHQGVAITLCQNVVPSKRNA